MLKVWEICDGEQWWIAAKDREDAILVYASQYSDAKSLAEVNFEDLPEPLEGLDVQEIDLEKMLTFTVEGEGKQTKTAFEWALEGRGLIASSCY